MLQLSSALSKLAITLYSTTIDSPTERTNSEGDPIRPTIYFDKPVTKDGKHVPGKKSNLYTPDAAEAKALKATQDSCECLCLDGAGKYDPANDLHFRFLKSTLNPALVKEVKAIKGLLAGNDRHVKLKKVMKSFTSSYIMGLPAEQKAMLVAAIDEIVEPVKAILLNTASDDEVDEPLFS